MMTSSLLARCGRDFDLTRIVAREGLPATCGKGKHLASHAKEQSGLKL
jgi:hypothetical protein